MTLARAEEAASALQSVEAWLPPQLLLAGATLYYNLGQAEQALERVERLLALQPDHVHAEQLRKAIRAAM